MKTKPNITMGERLRRKAGHNYSGVSAYMITVTVADRKPLLGTLEFEAPGDAHVTPTPLGLAVISAFYDTEKQVLKKTGCSIQIIQYQLMPDHFHGIIYIKESLPKEWSLGRIIAGWKGECSRAYWRITSMTGSVSSESLFAPGYHDRILNGKGQMQRWICYLHDNPRRLAFKRLYPDLFRIHQQIQIAGTNCTTLGNIFLAEHPQRAVLQCSRSMTKEQIEAKKKECLSEASNGTVYITAAISEGEKQIARAIREASYPLIVLLEKGFPEPDSPHYKYYKPQGVYFEACATGKLLLVEPSKELFERPDIVAHVEAKVGQIPHETLRYRFVALNTIAEEMSKGGRDESGKESGRDESGS